MSCVQGERKYYGCQLNVSMLPWWRSTNFSYECLLFACIFAIATAAFNLHMPVNVCWKKTHKPHYDDVRMGAIASQLTSLTIVYSTVYSDADQRKHQSSASLAFVRGIHRGTGEFPAQMASYAENVSIWWRHHAEYFRWLVGWHWYRESFSWVFDIVT